MSTPGYTPRSESKWNREQIEIDEHDGRYGGYIRIETPGITHCLALIDDTVVANPRIEQSVIDALSDAGYDVSV